MGKEKGMSLKFFRSLKEFQLKINPRLFSKTQTKPKTQLEKKEKNVKDRYTEIVDKIDALNVSNKKDIIFKEVETNQEEKIDSNSDKVVFKSVKHNHS